VAINENIRIAVLRWVGKGRPPTEVFMSTITQHHLADELWKRVPENYANPKHVTQRGKPFAVYGSDMARRVPTELTFGKVKVVVRIRESVATDQVEFGFNRLRKQIDYKSGREELVAETDRR
jgi:hypothetical protein